MKVLAFVNTKGGVGKTTVTNMTGMVLTRMGYKVLVRDADPAGSTYAWKKKARANGTPLPYPVEVASASSIDDIEGDEEYDFILIDTPPDVRNNLSRAIDDTADIIVLVTKPGFLDRDRTSETYNSFDSPRAILLNFARPRTRSTRETLAEIDGKGLARFETTIPDRESTHNASEGGNRVPTDSGFNEFTLELLEALKD